MRRTASGADYTGNPPATVGTLPGALVHPSVTNPRVGRKVSAGRFKSAGEARPWGGAVDRPGKPGAARADGPSLWRF